MVDPIVFTAAYWDFWIVQGFFALTVAERLTSWLF